MTTNLTSNDPCWGCEWLDKKRNDSGRIAVNCELSCPAKLAQQQGRNWRRDRRRRGPPDAESE